MTGNLSAWAKLCSLKAGAGAVLLFEPDTLEKLQDMLQSSRKPPLILGNGTNLVGSDSTEPMPVLRLGRKAAFGSLVPISNNRFRAGCACNLTRLLKQLASMGFGGLSGLCGIPGTVGGALAMNAGANGQEIALAVEAIEGWDMCFGQPWQWRREQGGWGYRQSPVPPGVIALQAVLQLQTIDADEENSLIETELERRRKVTPTGASAGSVFRNPSPGQPAGRLLEQAGCKGLTSGVFSVSEQHANWIVNLSRTPGSARDCRKLTQLMQQKVREKFAIDLYCEWRWADRFF